MSAPSWLSARAGLIAGVLLVAGCGVADTTDPHPVVTTAAGGHARRAVSDLPVQAPTRLTLPDGTEVRVHAARTLPNGRLDVPDDVRAAGWWNGGARLGDPFGAMLLAIHVDSRRQGLGPAAQLLTVAAGERLWVSSADGEQEFAVRRLRLVRRDALTAHRWVHAASGRFRLVLVTCAPPYDPGRGYRNLAVVTALPVGDWQEQR